MTENASGSIQVPCAISACGSTRVAIVLFVAAMTGCASPCPPFRAAWYLVDSPEAAAAAAAAAPAASSVASAPTVFLALLNEGPKKLKLSRLSINPTDENDGTSVFLWPDRLPATKPELWPGQLRLFAVNDPDDCVLPVVVKLDCGNCHSRTQAVSGSLPNYLHSSWIKSCVKRGTR